MSIDPHPHPHLPLFILYPLLFLVFIGFHSHQPATAGTLKAKIHALVIYARAANDHYPFPSRALRDSMTSRASGLFRTVSYGKHELQFTEVTNDGGFFVSEHAAGYYKKHYDRGRHLRGFGMFNEEILIAVKARFGDELFESADLLVVVGTDGGLGWYIPKANATGYGMLGVDFEAGGKLFGGGQRQGGLTIEIGSSVGTLDPEDDHLLLAVQIYWTLAHEYGHWLGLGHRSARRGIYSLMSPNLFTNDNMPANGPAPPDIFEIIKLGWLDETDRTRVVALSLSDLPVSVTLASIRSRAGPVFAKLEAGNTTYYFAYHQRSNLFDGVYLGKGLLCWQKGGRQVRLWRAGANSSREASGVATNGNSIATDFVNSITEKTELPIHSALGPSQPRGASRSGLLPVSWLSAGGDTVTFHIGLP